MRTRSTLSERSTSSLPSSTTGRRRIPGRTQLSRSTRTRRRRWISRKFVQLTDNRPDDGLQLMAVDPGGTTGWAVFWIPTANMLVRDLRILEDAEYRCGQATGPEEQQVKELIDVMRDIGDAPVIIEDFILRQFRQDRGLLSPVRVTAMLEFAIWERGWDAAHPIRKQQASLAKSTVTDERLRDWGFWEPGMPHARDALRHALTFLRRAKADRALARWAWPFLA